MGQSAQPPGETEMPESDGMSRQDLQSHLVSFVQSHQTGLHARIEAIETAYDLWARENDVKTTKLYVYILTQSILVTAYAFGGSSNGVLIPQLGMRLPLVGIFVSIIGIGSSWMSFVSIGRTIAFQKAWKRKRRALVKTAPEPARTLFDFYPTQEDKERYWYGTLGSKYIVLAPPLIGFALWVLILVGGLLIWVA